ncbi:restriction endonuclease [Streptomyces sp. G6]|uniref:restriction endonuclease n=1 Tax=Streptomyces sp. G6 TaxID=1178736 RepID=UPI003EDB0D83
MGRLRLRRPRGVAELIATAVVALAVLVLMARTVATAVGVLRAAWPALLALALLTGIVAVCRIMQATTMRRRERERLATLRITLAEFDAMDDSRFEYALRDLLVRDGWPARRVSGGGDQAADVIGDHPQRGRIVVQAKHTRVGGKVGSSVMYAVKGTACDCRERQEEAACRCLRAAAHCLRPGRHDLQAVLPDPALISSTGWRQGRIGAPPADPHGSSWISGSSRHAPDASLHALGHVHWLLAAPSPTRAPAMRYTV